MDFTNFCIRASLNGARRLCKKGKGKATGIFPDDLVNIFMELSMSNINDLVFWSAVTLAFRCLLRASNYCHSRHCVRIKDFVFVEGGVVVKILSSKTNQFSEYISEIPLYMNNNSLLCPIKWVVRMLRLRRASPEEQLFMIFNKGRWVPMTSAWFNRKLKLTSKIKGVSSHGLRRGGATYMLQNKFKLAEVKQRGQWKSANICRYPPSRLCSGIKFLA